MIDLRILERYTRVGYTYALEHVTIALLEVVKTRKSSTSMST
jgi:hypothetical protein